MNEIWPKVRLGDVGTLIRGKGIKRSETCATGKPCIRYGEIYTSFNVLLDKPRSFVDDALFDDCPHIKKGDLVLTLTGENKEEIAKTLCYLGDEEIAAGGDLAIWSGHGCDPKFLAYLMYSPAMIKAKADASNGHIVVHASVKKLQDIEIPLPPLAEQKKIVEKVEKALKREEALKAQFERMEKSAADYFKAALAETFAEVKGEKVKLGDVCETITDGDHQPPPKTNEGVPFLVISNVAEGVLDFKATRHVPMRYYEAIDEKRKPRMGDVLLTVTGSFGIPVLVDTYRPFCFQRHIALLRPSKMIPEFLKYLMVAPESAQYFDRVATGAAQRTVSLSSLREMKVTLPQIRIQREVVKRLTEMKDTASRLEAAARRGIEICGKMRKAILAESFQ